MNEISVSLVKDLRDKTGAGMMNCKKALVKSAGDIEGAIDWLRTSGLAAAAKKSGRLAAEGLVAVKTSVSSGVVIEVNAETDFVARNDDFKEFVNEVACLALTAGSKSTDLLTGLMDNGETVNDTINALIAKIGENIKLRRVKFLEIKDGVICSYIHNSIAPGLGKIGVLVGIESEGKKGALEKFGKQLAMHVAASNPLALDIDEIDNDVLKKEEELVAEELKNTGKPEDIVKKISLGKMNKFKEENSLLNQAWVMEPKKKVKNILKELNISDLKIKDFFRLKIGE